MASTVSLIQMLATGCFTSTGAPIASGKVRFYLPGTLTPVNVYADSAAASPISPPLTLTAGGTGIAYTKVPTRLIVKDSTETTTYFDGLVNIHRAEQLEIQSSSVNGGTETTLQALLDGIGTSFGGVAGLWQFKAGTGGTERNYVSVINDFGISVKSFGAVGDGIVDDTTAIQNTVTFVAGLGGGVVVFPPGTYKTSSAVSVGAAIEFIGAGDTATTIRATNATQNVFTCTAPTRYSKLKITHSSTSSGSAISSTAAVTLLVASVGDSKFANGVVVTGAYAYLVNATVQANSAVAGFGVSGGGIYAAASTVSGNFGAEIAATFLGFITGSGVVGLGSSGLVIRASAGNVSVAGGYCTGNSSGVVIEAAVTSAIAIQESVLISPNVSDSRTGAPVNYTFAADGNFTPLPLQASAIRATVTAAAVVTINAIAATGFGRKFSLICTRATAGAVTWTFNAQYVLSAAVAPANGNRVNLLLEYNPIDNKVYEIGRAATAN